jgi:hypothetical protein
LVEEGIWTVGADGVDAEMEFYRQAGDPEKEGWFYLEEPCFGFERSGIEIRGLEEFVEDYKFGRDIRHTPAIPLFLRQAWIGIGSPLKCLSSPLIPYRTCSLTYLPPDSALARQTILKDANGVRKVCTSTPNLQMSFRIRSIKVSMH